MIEKVNFIKKHQKPTSAQSQGGIVEKEGQIHASNVMLYDSRAGSPTRVNYRLIEDEDKKKVSKVRISNKSGEIL